MCPHYNVSYRKDFFVVSILLTNYPKCLEQSLYILGAQ